MNPQYLPARDKRKTSIFHYKKKPFIMFFVHRTRFQSSPFVKKNKKSLTFNLGKLNKSNIRHNRFFFMMNVIHILMISKVHWRHRNSFQFKLVFVLHSCVVINIKFFFTITTSHLYQNNSIKHLGIQKVTTKKSNDKIQVKNCQWTEVQNWRTHLIFITDEPNNVNEYVQCE